MEAFLENPITVSVFRRLDKSTTRQRTVVVWLLCFWAVRLLLCYHLKYFEIDDMLATTLLLINLCFGAALSRFATSPSLCRKYLAALAYGAFLWSSLCTVDVCVNAFVSYLQFYSCEIGAVDGKCVADVQAKSGYYLNDAVCTYFGMVVPFGNSWKPTVNVWSLVATMFALAYGVAAVADLRLYTGLWRLIVLRMKIPDENGAADGYRRQTDEESDESDDDDDGADDDDFIEKPPPYEKALKNGAVYP